MSEMIERLEMQASYSAAEAGIHIARYLLAREFCKGKVVLDAACDEGYGSHLLYNWGAKHVTGVDIDANAIKSANQNFAVNNRIEYLKLDIENLNHFENQTFDLIVSFETIEHLKNPELFLSEIKRLIKPDGIVIITCPNDYYYYPQVGTGNPYHLKKYTLEEFAGMAQAILGPYSSAALGGAIAGYTNTPYINSQQINVTQKQLEMLELEVFDRCVKVPTDKPISPNNASYYALLWSFGDTNLGLHNNATCYETDIDSAVMARQNAAFYENMKTLNDFEKISSECFALNEQISQYTEQINRQNEQISCQAEQVNQQNEQIKDLTDELKKTILLNNQITNEYDFMKNVWNSNKSRLELLEATENELQDTKNRLESIYNSLSYRSIQKILGVIDKIRGISK